MALLVVILVNLGHAIPLPRISEPDLEDPDWYRVDVARWTQVAQSLGLSVEHDWLRDRARGFAWELRQVLDRVRAPGNLVFRSLKADQQWGLFASVTELPDRLVVEVDRGEGWQRVYARLDREHAWRDDRYKYRRVRGIWDSVKADKPPRGTYRRLAVWTARELLDADPSIERVRFVLEQRRLTLPWEPLDEAWEPRAERIHDRQSLP